MDQRFTHPGYGGGLVTCIFRKQLIIENEIKFPEHLKYEDNYWSAVIRLYIRSFYHIADNCYHYRQREDSTVYKKYDLSSGSDDNRGAKSRNVSKTGNF